MPGRKYEAQSGYRYGFNGKEKDKDLNSLTAYDYGFRIYNPGIGKFLSVDPLTKDYPWYTPYQFAGNKPISCIDLDGLEEVEVATTTSEKIGSSVLKIAWKEGNGKVVDMFSKSATTSIINFRSLIRAGILTAIPKIFGSGTLTSQQTAGDYRRVAGTSEEDGFWRTWIGPGRRFPLPPLNPVLLPDWLVKYWPEGKPISVPNPGQIPNVDSKPDDESDDDDEYITLYRGVSKEINPGILFDMAEDGIAYPKGLLPGHDPHRDPEDHTMGDNESIFTSWSTSYATAQLFARGVSGKSSGVILSKKFKITQLIRSALAGLMGEGEYLIPGVVSGASVKDVEKRN